MKYSIYNGCDLLDTQKAKELLGGKKLGHLTNMSGVSKDHKLSTVEIASKFNLCALLAPEHGIMGAKQAGNFDDKVFCDPETGIPVYDIFGLGKIPESTEEAISKLDAVIINIQDIGVRYYTYQFALLDLMKICTKYSKEVIILDRINPLGGVNVLGNRIEKECVSGVGAVESQPALCGMTIGELALWFNAHLGIGAEISVLPCDGWSRDMWYDDTDLLFVPPSPNMPSIETAILYPGTCFIEGTNLSEGRGTTKPFELFGAPWFDCDKFLDGVASLPAKAKEAFEGLVFRKCCFTPVFSKHKDTLCTGIQLHLRDRNYVDMYSAGLSFVYVIKQTHPNEFEFTRTMPLLTGTQKSISDDFIPCEYAESQKSELEKFKEERNKFLIY